MNTMTFAQLIALMIPIFVVFMGIAGVMMLFPLMRRLGQYLDIRTEERRSFGRGNEDWNRVMNSLEAVEKRLSGLEERQDFVERLLERPRDESPNDRSS